MSGGPARPKVVSGEGAESWVRGGEADGRRGVVGGRGRSQGCRTMKDRQHVALDKVIGARAAVRNLM